jgi:hypothetical protein
VEGEEDVTTGVLDETAKAILRAANDDDDDDDDADEIYHVTFSYGLPDDEKKSDGDSVAGLHVLRRTAMSLVVDEAFEQAQRVFISICGDKQEEFLALSTQMEIKLKEQLQDAYRSPNVEDDTEQVALASAMEIIGREDDDKAATSTSTSTVESMTETTISESAIPEL